MEPHGLSILQSIFKIFFIINTCKISFTYCGPTQPLGAMTLTLTDLLLNYVRKLLVQWFLFYTCTKGFPYCDPTWPQGPWFLQTCFCTMLESFQVNLSFSGPVVLEKNFFQIFSLYIDIYKTAFPYCGPIQPPGAMIFINLILYFVREFSWSLHRGFKSYCETRVPVLWMRP
jgi:hypothetical protein